ncbi:MAG: ATP-binding protein [Acidobacteria bacterium]|nr:ATP-binding protein [Acidobacteriota bacterium]
MADFEKLGLFYLGRPVDATGATTAEPYLLDSRDLTTHAICVGMTGSGKTGLCLDLLEEAAIDGVPVIAIDPKGDVGNLLLTFPDLDAASFAPWVEGDAAAEAEKWRTGLAAWGQDGARIARLRQAADVVLYTPGSTAARPLSIINSLAAPPAAVLDDAEVLGDRVASTVGSLLSLLGLDADPLTSRDHSLLATILHDAWTAGRSLDLGALIQAVQTPAVTRVGVMDLEAFYPQKDRFVLATRMNNLLAAPGFSAWLQGDPLDVGQLLYGPNGKPRISIISVAHLDDAERMFVVSLLLGEVVAWMRTQQGTTSLRALVYMDEMFGFLPPVANPPSKGPLLTLLKQARAFGVGVCLATQNPVDLDYKAISNAGTWFIGRLQTDRDRARLLDGLEGSAGGAFDRNVADATITGLGKRRFYVHSVHAKGPVVIESRWCLSYLKGPLTRDDMKRLRTAAPAAAATAPVSQAASASARRTPVVADTQTTRPLLPPEIPQFFVPVTTHGEATWVPHLYGAADVDFSDAKRGIDERRVVTMAVPLDDGGAVSMIDWDQAEVCDTPPGDLQAEPSVDGPFAAVPSQALQPKSFARWSKDFDRWVSRTQRLDLFRHVSTGTVSRPGEDERTFRIRLADVVRSSRDAAVQKVRTKYASKLDTATEKVRRLELSLEKEQQDVSQHRVQAGLSTASTIGSAVLGAIFGRRGGMTASTIGKASTAAKGWARGSKEAEDVKRAEQNLAAARQALLDLETEITRVIEGLDGAAAVESLEPLTLAPKRGGVHVHLVALVWVYRA